MSASSLPAIASLSEIENHALVLIGIDFIGLIEIHKNDKVNRRPVSQRFVIFHQAGKKIESCWFEITRRRDGGKMIVAEIT